MAVGEHLFQADETDIKNYRLQIDLFHRNKEAFPFNHIVVCKCPPIYKELGIEVKDFRLHTAKIEKARMGHELPGKFFDNLPQLLADPVYIMKSRTQPGRFVVVLNETTFNRESQEQEPILAIINIANKSVYFPSFYCKNNFNRFLEENFEEGNILYADKEKALNIKPRCSNCTEDIFKATSIIATKEKIVNNYFESQEKIVVRDNSKEQGNNIKLKQEGVIYAPKERITSFMQAAEIFRELKYSDREKLYSVSLDDNNKILGTELVSIGSINSTAASPASILKTPLEDFPERKTVNLPLIEVKIDRQMFKKYELIEWRYKELNNRADEIERFAKDGMYNRKEKEQIKEFFNSDKGLKILERDTFDPETRIKAGLYIKTYEEKYLHGLSETVQKVIKNFEKQKTNLLER